MSFDNYAEKISQTVRNKTKVSKESVQFKHSLLPKNWRSNLPSTILMKKKKYLLGVEAMLNDANCPKNDSTITLIEN